VNEQMRAKGVPLANGGKGATAMSELSLSNSDTLLRLLHALDANAGTAPGAIEGYDAPRRAAAALDWVADHAILSLSQAEDLTDTSIEIIHPLKGRLGYFFEEGWFYKFCFLHRFTTIRIGFCLSLLIPC